MVVTVFLHTILQRQTPQGPVRELQMDLPEGTTLQDLLEKLEITLDLEDLLLVINGKQARPDQRLVDQDEVQLIPAMSGGGLL